MIYKPLLNCEKIRKNQMKSVAAVILGGGQGTRLNPLTMSRCKPALSIAGRYRLIDIPLSNAINSGCKKIFVITQFLSSSLHSHILSTYRTGNISSLIEILGTEERPENKTWFQGTADAVRQNLHYLEDTHVDYFLILSGDQLYQMDFNYLLDFAKNTDADMVISCLPIKESDVNRMGIIQIDDRNFITDFVEKPQNISEIKRFKIKNSKGLDYHASMGIYLFKRKTLIDLLNKDKREDFGKHLIPKIIKKGRSAAFVHQGYWEDIGTVASFYAANMAMTHPTPVFNCYDELWPIFSKQCSLPGARVHGAKIHHSLLCEGAIVEEAEVSHSIIGPRTLVKSGSKIQNTYIMGNEFFKTHQTNKRLPGQFHIGNNCTIKKAIIDRHVCIGNNVQLINKKKLSHYDGNNIYIRDSIIIVPQGTSIPNNFIL
jgi:glucose-1-phosphate adenylyltransferase